MKQVDKDLMEQGWQDMHTLLDWEMPVKRRRRLAWIWLLCGLVGLALVWVIGTTLRPGKPALQDNTEKLPVTIASAEQGKQSTQDGRDADVTKTVASSEVSDDTQSASRSELSDMHVSEDSKPVTTPDHLPQGKMAHQPQDHLALYTESTARPTLNKPYDSTIGSTASEGELSSIRSSRRIATSWEESLHGIVQPRQPIALAPISSNYFRPLASDQLPLYDHSLDYIDIPQPLGNRRVQLGLWTSAGGAIASPLYTGGLGLAYSLGRRVSINSRVGLAYVRYNTGDSQAVDEVAPVGTGADAENFVLEGSQQLPNFSSGARGWSAEVGLGYQLSDRWSISLMGHYLQLQHAEYDNITNSANEIYTAYVDAPVWQMNILPEVSLAIGQGWQVELATYLPVAGGEASALDNDANRFGTSAPYHRGSFDLPTSARLSVQYSFVR